MSRFMVVGLMLFLVGCEATVKTHAIRGATGIEIDCSGLGSDWKRCYERAARECDSSGYKVLSKSSDAKDEEGDYPFGWNPAGYVTRTMLVMCR
ncbi:MULTISPECIES: hypothetical protein [Pseudomonas]|uniref:hypothetical protein n=1 Tax=Pseudomonas TaxID=286 RepID=UPI0009F8B8F9|nr:MULTISPECIES: hypothetical protein [Pseudomonas]